jgi:hypothetical protein
MGIPATDGNYPPPHLISYFVGVVVTSVVVMVLRTALEFSVVVVFCVSD